MEFHGICKTRRLGTVTRPFRLVDPMVSIMINIIRNAPVQQELTAIVIKVNTEIN